MARFSRGTVLWIATIWFATTVIVTAKASPQGDEKTTKQTSLVDLAKLYHEFGLPHPSKASRLVRTARVNYSLEQNAIIPAGSDFAFEEPEKNAQGQCVIWSGLTKQAGYTIEERYDFPPKPETMLRYLKWEQLNHLSGIDEADIRPELIFAIQCQLASHADLARFFLRRCQKTTAYPLHHHLLYIAVDHWAGQLHDAASDRAVVIAKLKEIRQRPEWKDNPSEGADHLLLAFDSFLHQMDLTLRPSKAKPQSIEAMIDAMVEYAGKWKMSGIALSDPPSYFLADTPEPEAILRLARLGFEAVPALIEHVDDQRLTRSAGQWKGAQSPESISVAAFESVGDVSRRILSMFFDLDTDHQFDARRNRKSWKINKKDYYRQWDAIKDKNEIDYSIERIKQYPHKTFDQLLELILAKNSNDYKSVYKLFLNKNIHDDIIYKLVGRAVHSKLPKNEKIDIFLEMSHHPSLAVQQEALRGLLTEDNALFSKTCMERMGQQPKDTRKTNDNITHLDFARLALYSDDRKIISKIVAYAKDLPIREKMSLLANLGVESPHFNKLEIYYFLSQFLQDDEVCKIEPGNGYFYFSNIMNIKTIEVRNFAAYQLMVAMQISHPLNDKTSPEIWRKVRDMVKDEVERQTEQEKKK